MVVSATPGVPAHELNSFWRRLMEQAGVDGVDKVVSLVNSGQLVLVPPARWYEENGVIYFKVDFTDQPTDGSVWIDRLTKQGVSMGVYARSVLMSSFFSSNFKPVGITSPIKVAVIKGVSFAGSKRTTCNVQAKAEKLGLIEPTAGLACLTREMFPDDALKDMGLRQIVVMHKPIRDSGNFMDRLGVTRRCSCYNDVGLSLSVFKEEGSDRRWWRGTGFAYFVR